MNLLNLEDQKFKVVEIQGYKFKIRYISPRDERQIGVRRASSQGGIPITSFTDNEFYLDQSVAIVDVCTEEMPKEFNQNESCINWPTKSLIIELAKAIQDHTTDIEQKLKKNRPIS